MSAPAPSALAASVVTMCRSMSSVSMPPQRLSLSFLAHFISSSWFMEPDGVQSGPSATVMPRFSAVGMRVVSP